MTHKKDLNDNKENNYLLNNENKKDNHSKKDDNSNVLNSNDLNIDVFNSVKKDNNSKLNDESPYHVSKMNSTESNK